MPGPLWNSAFSSHTTLPAFHTHTLTSPALAAYLTKSKWPAAFRQLKQAPHPWLLPPWPFGAAANSQAILQTPKPPWALEPANVEQNRWRTRKKRVPVPSGPLIHSLGKYLLSSYYGPDSIGGTKAHTELCKQFGRVPDLHVHSESEKRKKIVNGVNSDSDNHYEKC